MFGPCNYDVGLVALFWSPGREKLKFPMKISLNRHAGRSNPTVYSINSHYLVYKITYKHTHYISYIYIYTHIYIYTCDILREPHPIYSKHPHLFFWPLIPRTWLGLIVAALELALSKVRVWADALRPRNPHHEEHRLVWHDYYSGHSAPGIFRTTDVGSHGKSEKIEISPRILKKTGTEISKTSPDWPQ